MFKIESQLTDGSWTDAADALGNGLTQDINSWNTHRQASDVCTELAAAGFDLNKLRVVEYEGAPTVDQVLADVKIGPNLYAWATDGALIEADGETMRAALEDAYDPGMPNWAAMVQMDTCGSDDD
jgi:hypothetical protein